MKNLMSNFIALKINILIVFILGACSNIKFSNIRVDTGSIRVDGRLKMELQITNKSIFKKVLNYPDFNGHSFICIKDRDSVFWLIPNSSKSSENYGQITLKPRQSTSIPYYFTPNMMLLPNKNYILKSIYYPFGNIKDGYNPNRNKKCLFPNFKEHRLEFSTTNLSKSELFEWNWINSHDLMRDYTNSRFRIVDKVQFEEIEEFIFNFPESIFLEKMKILYIRYVLVMIKPELTSQEYFEKAIKYTLDVEKSNPMEVEDCLLQLNKKKDLIKN